PDAHTEPETAVIPEELELRYRGAQNLGRLHRLVEATALEQHTELVAAETREGIAPADFGLEQGAELAEQSVACTVPAGIVDDLELIEVQVTKCVGGFPGPGAFQRSFQSVFELPPVDQPRQDVVTGVIAEPPIQLARLAHVVEYQDAAGDLALAVADWRGGALDIQLVAVAADQQCRTDGLDRAVAADRNREGILERLAGFFVKAAEDIVDRPAARIVDLPAG